MTRECNQRCRFCSNPPSGKTAELTELSAQVDDLVGRGCTGVILTGGEPTLYPELPALVAHVASRGVGCRVITNGQRLAEGPLLDALATSGLGHVHLSLYSHRRAVQDMLTRCEGSHARALAALERLGSHPSGITVDLNVVINHFNADHLDGIARFVVGHLPFVRHVVWNCLDPSTERVAEFPETVPKLWELEVPLQRALHLLSASGLSFRVERVPLCYLGEWGHISTETRKIVKEEPRLIHFLDDKALVRQESHSAWQRGKGSACSACRLDPVCAGLDSMDEHYDSGELSPVFLDPKEIVARVRGEA